LNNLEREMNIIYEEMSYIGFRVNFTKYKKENSSITPDIERTLVKILYRIDFDGRLLGLLFSWVEVHGSHIVADKLFKEYQLAKKINGESPWFVALCAYLENKKDHRFKKGIKKLRPIHHFGNRDQTNLVKLKGSVKVFEDVGIFVPQSAFRIREKDVMSTNELIKNNHQYKNRFIYGANWRSEIITTIQKGAINPNQVSKMLGIARSRVGVVFYEYMMIKNII
jgi:hypothetical protein